MADNNKTGRTLEGAFGQGITKRGSGTNDAKGSDIITKQASADVKQTSAFWYSPELTQESWLLPKSRQEILKWCRIFYNLEPYIGCLAGETKVQLLNGKEKTIKELYEEKAKNIWLYSVSEDGQITPGKAQEVKMTRTNAEVWKVTLDNNESFECTPDHKIMMRDGTYKEARDLKSGDSLMPLYKKISTEMSGKKKFKGYEQVYDLKSSEYKYTHRVVYDALNNNKSKGVIHHQDFTKLNNEPSNLKKMSWKEHIALHKITTLLWKDPIWRSKVTLAIQETKRDASNREIVSKNSIEMWADPIFVEKMKFIFNSPEIKEKINKFNFKNKETLRKALDVLRNTVWNTKEFSEKQSVKTKAVHEAHPELAEQHSILMQNRWERGEVDTSKHPFFREGFQKENNNNPEIKEKNRKGQKEYWSALSKEERCIEQKRRWGVRRAKKLVVVNHKVVSAEKCSYKKDVYDIIFCEPYYNFALSCGIFVHNSILDMHSLYPFSKFDIVTPDKSVTEFYKEMAFNEGFDLYGFMLKASLSYQKFGEAIIFLNKEKIQDGPWKNKVRWSKGILLEPELVEIKQEMFEAEPVYEMIPTQEMKKLVDSLRPGDDERSQKIPKAIITAIQSGKNIMLDSKCVSAIQRLTDPSATRGTPIMQRCFKVCLSGDTKISLLNGTNPTIEELYTQNKKDFYVYSIDSAKNIITVKAEEVVYNGEKEVVEVILDDDTSFKCTEDHKIMLRDGTYKEAGKLEVNESLMPLYKRQSYFGNNKATKYEQILNPNNEKWLWTHVVSLFNTKREQFKLKGNRTIHHEDFNSLNNDPDNLNMITRKKHGKIHREHIPSVEFLTKISREANSNPDVLEKKSISMKKLWDSDWGIPMREALKGRHNDPIIEAKRIATLKISTSTEEYKNKKSSIQKERLESNPEFLKNFREGCTDYWEISENKQRRIEAISAAYNNLTEEEKQDMLNKRREGTIKNWVGYSEEEKTLRGKILSLSGHISKTKDSELKSKLVEELTVLKQELSIFKLNKDKVLINHKVKEVRKLGKEKVYDIVNAGEFHNFAIYTGNDSGIFVSNCIFQDKIRLAQMAAADRYHFPVELWTVGDLGTNILPTTQELEDVRTLITAAISNPPFSLVFPPIIKYEALGVTGKLLPLSDDYTYIQDQLMVGLGVNKQVVTGEGPSFSGLEGMSLQKLIMVYKTIRDEFENWMINKFFRPIAIENEFYYYVGDVKKLILPQISWYKSLDIKEEETEKESYVKLHERGYISTKTLFSKFPNLDFDTETKHLEMEKATIFDKEDRIPKEFIPSTQVGQGAGTGGEGGGNAAVEPVQGPAGEPGPGQEEAAPLSPTTAPETVKVPGTEAPTPTTEPPAQGPGAVGV